MDFALSEDQRLLEKTVRDFLAARAPIEWVREQRAREPVNDAALWRALGELGVAGMLAPEKHGGGGHALLDAALVSQALGHAATPTPFLASAVLATTALTALADCDGGDRDAGNRGGGGGAGDGRRRDDGDGGGDSRRRDGAGDGGAGGGGRDGDSARAAGALLAKIASGKNVCGVACTELFSVREDAGVALRNGALFGKAMMALDACAADFIFVTLDATRCAVVRAADAGVKITRLKTVDATRCTSELVLDGATPELVFENAAPAIARMLDAGRIALAADALGCCEAMLERAVAYAQERKQFGRVIGSFQAVKHMCAEMVAALEPARALLWYAAHSFDALPDEAPLMACHALAHTSEVAREIASVATQVHGGIGWTDEQNLHFWFKRIANARHLLGGPELLRARAAALQGFAPNAHAA